VRLGSAELGLGLRAPGGGGGVDDADLDLAARRGLCSSSVARLGDAHGVVGGLDLGQGSPALRAGSA
jgi:hypothetical protein